MKKIFFFAALVISASMMAQTSSVNWYDLVEPINSIAQGTTSYENVQVNAAGDILLTGKVASVGMDPHAVVFGDTVATVAFKENSSQTNEAPFFVKVNEDGDVKWMVVCNDGRFTSYATLPLADGGLLVAATAYQSQQSVISFASHYTPANTAKYEQDKTQYGVLLKIDNTGKPSILTKFEQAEVGKTDGIAFRGIETDGTNFFVLANVKSAVKIAGKTDTIAPKVEGGSLAILKFNAKGELQGQLQTEGVAVTASTAKLIYANEKLYSISGFKGAANDNLKLGSASVEVPNDLNNIAVFVAKTDLTGEAVHVIAGEKVNNKNSITTYGVVADASALFISGFYQGGIVTEAGTLANNTSTNGAFVIKFDLAQDKAVKGLLLKAGTGISSFQVDGLLAKGDSLYAYYYDWGATGDRVFLQAMDKDLALGSRLGLVNTATMGSSRAAAFQGDNLVYTYYAPKGLSKLSADNDITVNPTAYRGLVVSQKVFSSPATSVSEVEESNQKITKQLNEGNVYILSGDKVYTAAGQKVQ